MNDSRLLVLFSATVTLVLLVLLVFLVVVIVRLLRGLLTSQEVENQRLRNQILTMGDLSALERLNKTTEVQRTQTQNSPNSSNSDKSQFNPNDIVNTPTGPVIEVPQPDGTIKIMSVADLDPGLMGMGWTPDPDMDIDAIVTPDGDYHAGPYQG